MKKAPCVLLLMVWATSAWAQAPGGGGAPTTQAVQLPLSTVTDSGAVAAQQTAGSGVDTVTSSIQVGGSYSGSIPLSQVPEGAIRLSLADAVKYGLSANLGPIGATNEMRVARAQRLQMLSLLLPNITANASDTVTQTNLAAYGFQFKVPANFNFSIPTVVGPYNYSSLQGDLSQTVFDLTARRNWQSAKASEHATVLSSTNARDLVVFAVGGSYLQVLTTEARVASQKAQVDNAQAIYDQAVLRKQAGTNARIDVSRSLVELQTEEQRLISLNSDLRKQLIQLARLVGLPQDREISLSDALSPNPSPVPSSETAIQTAFNHRADLQATEAQVKAAEITLSAARAERMPTASVSGYYGVIGPNPTSTHGVFAATGSVTLPIFQGGRISADIEQAKATLDQRRAELADEKGSVEQGVRNALIELDTSIGQVKIAESNRTLASETLTQARDRFAAGVTTTLEVVQAQQQVEGAESDYISSLFSMNLARLSLAREMGNAEAGLIIPKEQP